jgi:ubiquinone/menaquinone biosynthesis C-methylase UbiE
LQHPDSRSFELVADVYERARPEYPREALEWIAAELDLRAGRTVLDLAAGTGKLTRGLVATGAHVIAVEPGEAMLAQLRAVLPEVVALQGGAEAIPLADDSDDAITVGQAFHWFRPEEAVPELHRVLRAGGAVALIWNSRDGDRPLQREISELIQPFFPPNRPHVTDSVPALTASGLFAEPAERQFRFAERLNADELVERIASVSFVAAAAPERRRELERNLRALVTTGTVDFAYLTHVYVSRAIA